MDKRDQLSILDQLASQSGQISRFDQTPASHRRVD